jgi:hypothetical protein
MDVCRFWFQFSNACPFKTRWAFTAQVRIRWVLASAIIVLLLRQRHLLRLMSEPRRGRLRVLGVLQIRWHRLNPRWLGETGLCARRGRITPPSHLLLPLLHHVYLLYRGNSIMLNTIMRKNAPCTLIVGDTLKKLHAAWIELLALDATELREHPCRAHLRSLQAMGLQSVFEDPSIFHCLRGHELDCRETYCAGQLETLQHFLVYGTPLQLSCDFHRSVLQTRRSLHAISFCVSV